MIAFVTETGLWLAMTENCVQAEVNTSHSHFHSLCIWHLNRPQPEFEALFSFQEHFNSSGKCNNDGAPGNTGSWRRKDEFHKLAEACFFT